MPWKCPACSSPIRRELNAAGHQVPEPDRIYRCGLCRLDLVLSRDGERMVIAPLPAPDLPENDPRR
jgi:hypothetical protein